MITGGGSGVAVDDNDDDDGGDGKVEDLKSWREGGKGGDSTKSRMIDTCSWHLRRDR